MSVSPWSRYSTRSVTSTLPVLALANHHIERHIEFDLGGLPHATISEDYLDRLSKHLRFESILKYVALPRLRMESPPVRGRNRG